MLSCVLRRGGRGCLTQSVAQAITPACRHGKGCGEVHLSGFGQVENSFSSVGARLFHSSQQLKVELKVQRDVQDGYSLLGVDEDCTDQQLKEAYLEKAKTFHPDTGNASANAYKFNMVKDAYKVLLEHRKRRKLNEEEEKEAEVTFDIRHTAPQHRQYLEFEGVGQGTPSQRQRQYQQYRVQRVTENVFQHRIQRHAAETESSLVLKDKQQARKAKISNAVHRMVEDLIQESMQRGDFNDLPGQGQPLAHTEHNPFVDIHTHNLNKILVNDGFAPEWIMLQSEIRKEMKYARQRLAVAHNRLGDPPHSSSDTKKWTSAMDAFKNEICEINVKIDKFNLIVPLLNKQKMPYSIDREVRRVLNSVKDYLPDDYDAYVAWEDSFKGFSASPRRDINWKQVWSDIKDVFQTSRRKDT